MIRTGRETARPATPLVTLCATLLAAGAPAAAPAGKVVVHGDKIVLAAGNYELILGKSYCWTIRSLKFRGTTLMADDGGCSNGTVLRTPIEEGAKSEWVGTGHGHEVVRAIALFVDGTERPLHPGATLAGSSFRLVKHSDLRVLDLEAVTELTATGVREMHRYTVKADRPNVALLYGFMHSFTATMTDWLVTAPDGVRHEGRFKNDNKNAFTGDLAWTGVYNPAAGIGAAYVFHTANVKPVHFYWDRDTDGKLYFNPSLDTKTMKAGDRFAYAVSLAAYAAPTDAWKDAAAASSHALKKRGPLQSRKSSSRSTSRPRGRRPSERNRETRLREFDRSGKEWLCHANCPEDVRTAFCGGASGPKRGLR